MNWQRHHSRDNANCTVSIWDSEKQQWIEKEDTGTESNTEREKGLASDSFKRACFNWGIGRELYTAPKMSVRPEKLKTFRGDNGRYTCRDTFKVTGIEYDGRRIAKVEVLNEKTKETLVFGEPVEETQKTEAVRKQTIGEAKARALETLCGQKGINIGSIYEKYSVTHLKDLTEKQHLQIFNWASGLPDKDGNNGTN